MNYALNLESFGIRNGDDMLCASIIFGTGTIVAGLSMMAGHVAYGVIMLLMEIFILVMIYQMHK